MNISIRDYFETTYTSELQEVLEKIIGLFDRLNIFTYETYILNTLSELENEDKEATSTNILCYLEGFMMSLQKEFGFQLTEELTLDQRVGFIRAYVDLEDYIDSQAIIRILETDELAIEKLSEAVALTSELSKDILISFIDSVEESSLETLERLHLLLTPKQELVDENESPQASEGQVRQVKAFNLFMKKHNLTVYAFDLIKNGYNIGLPFSIYWEKDKERVLALPMAEACPEFIAILLMSKEYWSNPQIAFNKLSEDWFENLTDLTTNNNMVKDLMSSFISFKLENRIK